MATRKRKLRSTKPISMRLMPSPKIDWLESDREDVKDLELPGDEPQLKNWNR